MHVCVCVYVLVYVCIHKLCVHVCTHVMVWAWDSGIRRTAKQCGADGTRCSHHECCCTHGWRCASADAARSCLCSSAAPQVCKPCGSACSWHRALRPALLATALRPAVGAALALGSGCVRRVRCKESQWHCAAQSLLQEPSWTSRPTTSWRVRVRLTSRDNAESKFKTVSRPVRLAALLCSNNLCLSSAGSLACAPLLLLCWPSVAVVWQGWRHVGARARGLRYLV